MNFPLLLSHALIGKTGNKSALWVHPSIRQHLLLYSSLFNIYINIYIHINIYSILNSILKKVLVSSTQQRISC